jgi:hypothetical protein
MSEFISPAWLKRGCPFSFKFLLFMAESGLLGHIKIIEMVEDEDSFDKTKEELSAKLGKPASFPTVEVEPGVYMSESDELIEYYAEQCGIDLDALEALPFYKRGLMKHSLRKIKDCRAYMEKYGPLE